MVVMVMVAVALLSRPDNTINPRHLLQTYQCAVPGSAAAAPRDEVYPGGEGAAAAPAARAQLLPAQAAQEHSHLPQHLTWWILELLSLGFFMLSCPHNLH